MSERTESLEYQKRVDEHRNFLEEKQREYHRQETSVRARSLTVGNAGGGTCEVIMRMPDSNITFTILQPVEVVELIHSLSANIGCHVELKPRNDFSSWRNWNDGTSFRSGLEPSDGKPHHVLPAPEEQPGLNMPTTKLKKVSKTNK